MGALGPTAANLSGGTVWYVFVACMAITAILAFATGSVVVCACGVVYSAAAAYYAARRRAHKRHSDDRSE